jgi:CheY-like chemotaxis protein
MKDKGLILVVEDDELLSNVYKSQLEKVGYTVQVTKHGQQALDFIKKKGVGKIELILLDLIMPIMNGFDFLAKLRKMPKYKDQRVVVLTNLGQDSDMKQCSEYEVNEYFVKTQIGVDEIVRIVSTKH